MGAGDDGTSADPAATTRKLAAILHADVAGYSRLMGQDEAGTHAHLIAERRLFETLVTQHGGRIVGTAGDAVLADFPSVIEALSAAVDIQAAIAAFNADVPADARMQFRIGVNIGDVIVDGDDIFGDGVNVAARVEALAEPGGIAISGAVYDQVRNKIDLGYRSLGEHRVKNIDEPIHIYAVDDLGTDIVQVSPHRTVRWPVLSGAALALLLALAAVYWLVDPMGRSSVTQSVDPASGDAAISGSGPPTLAVLPFENQSGDPDQDYFSDGITGDVISSLGRFSDLVVLSWSAVAGYAGQSLSPEQLGRDLGVRYLVGGTVRRAGDQLRVTVQLTDAEQGVLLWSERYDGTMDDVFAVQDEIARHVVGALTVRLTRLEQDRAFQRAPADLNAYDHVLRGRDFVRRIERAANREARAQFEQARTLDPDYADAYVGLALTYMYDFLYGWTEWPDRAIERASELAEQGIELDEQSAQAHAVLAITLIYRQLPDRAAVEIERALELNPNDTIGLAIHGVIMTWSGRPEAAVASLEQVMRLDPSPVAWWVVNLAESYYLLNRYEDAIMLLERYRRQFDEDPAPFIALAAAYAQLGRTDEAANAVASLRRLSPFFSAENYATGFVLPEHRMHLLEGLRAAGLE